MQMLRHVLTLTSRWKCSPAEEAIKILFVRISLWRQAESVILRNNHSYMIHCAFLPGTAIWSAIQTPDLLYPVQLSRSKFDPALLLRITALLFTLLVSWQPTLYLSVSQPGSSFSPVCGQIDFNCFIITNLICAERCPCAVWNLLFTLSVVQEVCYTGQR